MLCPCADDLSLTTLNAAEAPIVRRSKDSVVLLVYIISRPRLRHIEVSLVLADTLNERTNKDGGLVLGPLIRYPNDLPCFLTGAFDTISLLASVSLTFGR